MHVQRSLTGATDLEEVTSLDMKVDTSENSLGNFGMLLVAYHCLGSHIKGSKGWIAGYGGKVLRVVVCVFRAIVFLYTFYKSLNVSFLCKLVFK